MTIVGILFFGLMFVGLPIGYVLGLAGVAGLIQVGGDREAVDTAVALARESGRVLAGSFVLSGVSPQVLEVLRHSTPPAPGDALGVVECRTVAAGIAAADAAAKRSAVTLARLVPGQGINGKSYFVIGGDVAAVEEAVEAARQSLILEGAKENGTGPGLFRNMEEA